jgi:hypothetical protein
MGGKAPGWGGRRKKNQIGTVHTKQQHNRVDARTVYFFFLGKSPKIMFPYNKNAK